MFTKKSIKLTIAVRKFQKRFFLKKNLNLRSCIFDFSWNLKLILFIFWKLASKVLIELFVSAHFSWKCCSRDLKKFGLRSFKRTESKFDQFGENVKFKMLRAGIFAIFFIKTGKESSNNNCENSYKV